MAHFDRIRLERQPRRRGARLRARLAALVAAGTVLLLALAARADESADFKVWLAGLRQDAIADGISAATVDEALGMVYVNSRVIELDRKQPEGTITFADYLARVITPERVANGRARLAELKPVLEEVAARYGVEPRFVVALWAVESNYGEQIGSYPVVTALATLAFEGRRAEFFRGELIEALHILDEGQISPGNMLGSWAGAMGQCQFMPSSYRRFAVDEDGDGKRNIWDSTADVLGSIANYLAKQNWRPRESWGRAVRLPAGFDTGLVTLDLEKSIAAWEALGVRRADGGELPGASFMASLVQPDGPTGPSFLVYPNYKVIMKWNRSTYFATAVGQLADLFAPE
jgi:peptidoglycan lytic transglycosylase B